MLLAVIALLAAAGAAVASGGTVIVSCHDAPPGPLPSCELLQGWLDARNAATLLSSLSERLHALGDGIQAGADVIHPYTGGVIGVCVWTDHVTCSLSVPGGEASSEASGPRVALVAHLDDAYARDLNTGYIYTSTSVGGKSPSPTPTHSPTPKSSGPRPPSLVGTVLVSSIVGYSIILSGYSMVKFVKRPKAATEIKVPPPITLQIPDSVEEEEEKKEETKEEADPESESDEWGDVPPPPNLPDKGGQLEAKSIVFDAGTMIREREMKLREKYVQAQEVPLPELTLADGLTLQDLTAIRMQKHIEEEQPGAQWARAQRLQALLASPYMANQRNEAEESVDALLRMIDGQDPEGDASPAERSRTRTRSSPRRSRHGRSRSKGPVVTSENTAVTGLPARQSVQQMVAAWQGHGAQAAPPVLPQPRALPPPQPAYPFPPPEGWYA